MRVLDRCIASHSTAHRPSYRDMNINYFIINHFSLLAREPHRKLQLCNRLINLEMCTRTNRCHSKSEVSRRMKASHGIRPKQTDIETTRKMLISHLEIVLLCVRSHVMSPALASRTKVRITTKRSRMFFFREVFFFFSFHCCGR